MNAKILVSSIPKELREKLNLSPNLPEHFKITLEVKIPKQAIRPDPEVEAEIAAGKVKSFDSVEEFLADLEKEE